MLFNSYEFILLFLPITLMVYWALNNYGPVWLSRLWLVLASLFYYGWWDPIYLILIVLSITFNYFIGVLLNGLKRVNSKLRKPILIFGISTNLIILGYFKYSDFFISTINSVAGANLSLLHITLPLAISFFTFQQIAYLVDTFQNKCEEYKIINYALFVSFFPQLIAGPIVHHSEVMPQFDRGRISMDYSNMSKGVLLFLIGLLKKVVLADTFSALSIQGFDRSTDLAFFEGWATSLSYSLQIYFDFSGYTDMALGSALMFNIKLPANFNSPYKATSIQDFWRRWHMTLTRFLRDYVYIPMGGNRVGTPRVLLNLMITFLLGGLWHGAGWNFVLWGSLHGLAMVIHRLWTKLNIKIPRPISWLITFNFVNATWVFFRAKSFHDAIKVLKSMFGLNGITLPSRLANKLAFLSDYNFNFSDYWLTRYRGGEKIVLLIIVTFPLILLLKNSNQIAERFRPTTRSLILAIVLAIIGIFSLNRITEFIYFNF